MSKTLGILYEHPDWFVPLFEALQRRNVDVVPIHVDGHSVDPTTDDLPYDLLLNRMSPSAGLRGRSGVVSFTTQLLSQLASRHVPVLNGIDAWRIEISKAAQIELLDRLGLGHPDTRFAWDGGGVRRAAEAIGYPLVVKPGVGGSGAGIVRFDEPRELEDALLAGRIDFGTDGVVLVQAYIPPEDGRIIRVEVLDGAFLYAIAVYAPEGDFNLCPADACVGPDGEVLERGACAVDAPRNGLRVEPFDPPEEVRQSVERILREARIPVGGVEYVVDARDGSIHYYDINALSNFVADGERVLGFDPFEDMADWLERELGSATVGGVGAPSTDRALVGAGD